MYVTISLKFQFFFFTCSNKKVNNHGIFSICNIMVKIKKNYDYIYKDEWRGICLNEGMIYMTDLLKNDQPQQFEGLF